MKLDINAVSTQIVFQSVMATVSLILVGGLGVLFIQSGTGLLDEAFISLSQISDILSLSAV
jgi:hypothetical protein